jgi:hypothetical protein
MNSANLQFIDMDLANIVYSAEGGLLYTADGTTLIEYSAGKKDTNVEIPERITCIGSIAFGGCTNLTSVILPESLTEIGVAAFYNCTALTFINLKNVQTIHSFAFQGSGLTSIVIPSSVNSISSYAFQRCASLTDVTVYWAKPLGITSDVFDSVDLSNATLRVPCGTKANYEAVSVWQRFGTIIEHLKP